MFNVEGGETRVINKLIRITYTVYNRVVALQGRASTSIRHLRCQTNAELNHEFSHSYPQKYETLN